MKTNQLKLYPEAYAFERAVAVDGDTIRCRIELGFGIHSEQRVRLKGFYAPEMDGGVPEQGLAARERLQAFLDANTLYLRAWGMKVDRYGRTVAELWWIDRAVTAAEVLGALQLSVEAHRADLLEAKRLKPTKAKKAPQAGELPGVPF